MQPCFQRYTLVARAIVHYEIELLGAAAKQGGGGLLTLTVPDIVGKYGLEWGAYHRGDDAPPRADQLIRNELNRAVSEGLLQRAEDEFGLPVRNGRWLVYVLPQESACRS